MSAKKSVSKNELEGYGQHYHVPMHDRQLYLLRHDSLWHPPTDVLEDDDRLYIVIEIAGMRDGDFQVTVANRVLSVRGVRPIRAQSCTAYHQLEIQQGEFRTEVNLPWAVDEDGIAAKYEDGLLRIELPRAEPRSVHVVEVDKIDNASYDVEGPDVLETGE
jgi:HSP20 family molecular chaperone IbpA